MTKVKMCGLSRLEDIDMVNALKPDYIGFVFHPKSKRYVDFEKAKLLKAKLDSDIKAVGVFVNVEINDIQMLLEENVIDVVQLHGSQNNDFIDEIRKVTDKPVFKAFSINKEEDLEEIERSKADLVLIDSPVAGSGKTFDWTVLKNIKRDFFLAGGLNPENIREALRTVHPYGVDVSSGIEQDGIKNMNKAKDFIETVRKEDENE